MRKLRLPLVVVLTLILMLVSGCGGKVAASNDESLPPRESSADNVEKSIDDKDSEQKASKVDVELGKTYSTEDFDVTFQEVLWLSPDEKGWVESPIIISSLGWTHQLGGFEGRTVAFVVADVYNKGNEALSLSNIVAYAQINGEYKYGIDFDGDVFVDPLTSNHIALCVAIPNVLMDDYRSGVMYWGINSNSNNVKFSIQEYDPMYAIPLNR